MTTRKKDGPGFFAGWFAGSMLANAVHGMAQDSYGGLEGYVEHLRKPGVWHDFDVRSCAFYTIVCTWVLFTLARFVRS